MNKKFYYVFCLICIAVIILASGCGLNRTKSGLTDTNNDKVQDRLTLDEVKQSYTKTDERILSVQEYMNYVLIESQAPTYSNHFTLYDLKTGDKDILPSGIDFIDSAKIIDENHIVLYAKGTNSQSVLQLFPHEIDCMRGAENSNSDGDFIPTHKDIKFLINKQISIKGKGKEEISDIRVTVNGLQVCFAPQSSNDASFYADYTDAPTTDISYDNTKGEFSIKFQDTIFAKQYAGTDSLPYSNIYIKSIKLKSEGNSSTIILKPSEMSKYYIGRKSNLFEYPFNIDTPYIDLQFSGHTD